MADCVCVCCVQETIDDILDPSLPTLEDLGVLPENVEPMIHYIMKLYANRKGFLADKMPTRLPPAPKVVFQTNNLAVE